MSALATAVPIPGGDAAFYDHSEMTLRRSRDLEVRGVVILPLVRRVALAREIRVDGVVALSDPILDGEPVDLTGDELAQIRDLNDLAVVTYLKSWTLDRPLPETVDEVRALPPALYAAVSAHAGKLAVNRETGFIVEALPQRMPAEAHGV